MSNLKNKHITYLIDTENKHQSYLEELSHVRAGDEVYLVSSPTRDKVDYTGVDKIQLCRGSVFVDLAVTGTPNALDFELSSLLGFLINKEPTRTFIIVTGDNGFVPLANYWKLKGISVHVCPKIGSEDEKVYDKYGIHPQKLEEARYVMAPTSANRHLFGSSTIATSEGDLGLVNQLLGRADDSGAGKKKNNKSIAGLKTNTTVHNVGFENNRTETVDVEETEIESKKPELAGSEVSEHVIVSDNRYTKNGERILDTVTPEILAERNKEINAKRQAIADSLADKRKVKEVKEVEKVEEETPEERQAREKAERAAEYNRAQASKVRPLTKAQKRAMKREAAAVKKQQKSIKELEESKSETAKPAQENVNYSDKTEDKAVKVEVERVPLSSFFDSADSSLKGNKSIKSKQFDEVSVAMAAKLLEETIAGKRPVSKEGLTKMRLATNLESQIDEKLCEIRALDAVYQTPGWEKNLNKLLVEHKKKRNDYFNTPSEEVFNTLFETIKQIWDLVDGEHKACVLRYNTLNSCKEKNSKVKHSEEPVENNTTTDDEESQVVYRGILLEFGDDGKEILTAKRAVKRVIDGSEYVEVLDDELPTEQEISEALELYEKSGIKQTTNNLAFLDIAATEKEEKAENLDNGGNDFFSTVIKSIEAANAGLGAKMELIEKDDEIYEPHTDSDVLIEVDEQGTLDEDTCYSNEKYEPCEYEPDFEIEDEEDDWLGDYSETKDTVKVYESGKHEVRVYEEKPFAAHITKLKVAGTKQEFNNALNGLRSYCYSTDSDAPNVDKLSGRLNKYIITYRGSKLTTESKTISGALALLVYYSESKEQAVSLVTKFTNLNTHFFTSGKAAARKVVKLISDNYEDCVA